MDHILARPHFEAVLSDLSQLYQENRHALREEIKTLLIKQNKIKFSTTELIEEDLKSIANRLTAFYQDQLNTPPEFRLELNLEKLITLQ